MDAARGGGRPVGGDVRGLKPGALGFNRLEVDLGHAGLRCLVQAVAGLSFPPSSGTKRVAVRRPPALSEDPQFDADVAARRAGVRADLVRGVGELAHLLAFHSWNVNDERDDQIERVALGTYADLSGHRGVAERGLLVSGHHPKRTVEAGGVGRREQLLGVAARTAAAQLGRHREVEVYSLVRRGDMAVAAVASRHRLRGVQNGVGHTRNPIAAGLRAGWAWRGAPRAFGTMNLNPARGRGRDPLRSVTR